MGIAEGGNNVPGDETRFDAATSIIGEGLAVLIDAKHGLGENPIAPSPQLVSSPVPELPWSPGDSMCVTRQSGAHMGDERLWISCRKASSGRVPLVSSPMPQFGFDHARSSFFFFCSMKGLDRREFFVRSQARSHSRIELFEDYPLMKQRAWLVPAVIHLPSSMQVSVIGTPGLQGCTLTSSVENCGKKSLHLARSRQQFCGSSLRRGIWSTMYCLQRSMPSSTSSYL